MTYDVNNGFFNEQTEQKIADSLLEKTKLGESVSNELNAIPLQDRIAIAKLMETKANSNPDIPDLVIKFDKDENGQEHLADMTVKGEWTGPAHGRPFFNKDVYDQGLQDSTVQPNGFKETSKSNIDSALNQKIAERQILVGELPQMELYQELVKAADTSVARRLGK